MQTHLKEMFSVIYTPTEGDAIQNYSRLFRKPEGCFLNIRDQDSIEECLSAFGNAEEVDYVVVSDGEEVCICNQAPHADEAKLLDRSLVSEIRALALSSYLSQNWPLPLYALASTHHASYQLFWIAGQM